ncbi:MAG TPA: hypothetical protein PKD64_12560 [Pirellulaceae bacterium]|nr:hypothetical protein [Pirellulaceae bacterium]HMO93019.1 hypothetical protein [Pirellulaceae bacterium]HMP67905.1 hypothetical protein [Pirellulaceae bacterium]
MSWTWSRTLFSKVIAGLLAIVDSINGKANDLFAAACACVSPTVDNWLEPSKSTRTKLKALEREIGSGSLLIRHEKDSEAEEFDHLFKTVWTVKELADLRDQLMQSGLLENLQKHVTLKPEHASAISARISSLMSSEETFEQAGNFIARLQKRFDSDTPLRIRIEVLNAEEDLHRHSGRFDQAILACRQRSEFENDPAIACYERRLQSDNRLAAALFDGHSFDEAVCILTPWMKHFEDCPQICLPETRAIVMNTLARCCVPLNDNRWENLFQRSLVLQKATETTSASRTMNYLIHGYLKTNRLTEAKELLAGTNEQSNDAYLIWLRADYERRVGGTCSNIDRFIHSIPWQNHVYGLILQALARQLDRSLESRLELLQDAKRSFEFGIEGSSTNIKHLLAQVCEIGIYFLENDIDLMTSTVGLVKVMLNQTGLSSASAWYGATLSALETSPTWRNVNNLFERVPHF